MNSLLHRLAVFLISAVSHCAIGMTGVVNVTSPSDILLYGSTGGDNANGGGRLWLIDVTVQSASLLGDTGFDRLGSIAFDSSGNRLRRLRRERQRRHFDDHRPDERRSDCHRVAL